MRHPRRGGIRALPVSGGGEATTALQLHRRSNDCGRRHLALGGAFALASLFGKLPATRAPLLKELKRKTVAKA